MKKSVIKSMVIVLILISTNLMGQNNSKQKPKIRIYEKKEYKMLDSLRIIIYSSTDRVTVQKKMPETHYQTNFYFSKTKDSEIFKLTIVNIEHAFPDDHKMHDAMMKSFPDEQGLSEYDDFHKTFRINRFLDQNLSTNK